MVEITLSIALQIIQTIGVLVGIIYYITIMRNTQKTREASLKIQEDTEKARQRALVYQRLQGYNLEYTRAYIDVASYTDWETVEEFREKYGLLTNPEAYSKHLYIRKVYNLAGILLMENVADADVIFRLYPPGAVISIWEQFYPYIQYSRKIRKDPTKDEAFEFLYNEAKKRYPEVLPLSAELK
jgi:hypothetical protein